MIGLTIAQNLEEGGHGTNAYTHTKCIIDRRHKGFVCTTTRRRRRREELTAT
jgi:hypothetical protein